jgi:hypothetical protein
VPKNNGKKQDFIFFEESGPMAIIDSRSTLVDENGQPIFVPPSILHQPIITKKNYQVLTYGKMMRMLNEVFYPQRDCKVCGSSVSKCFCPQESDAHDDDIDELYDLEEV